MSLKAYIRCMRLDKPIGIFLLWYPVAWALWIVYKGHPPYYLISLMFIGTCLMRSAGCVINDIADRQFDGFVERTAGRPLAIGDISLIGACLLVSALCFLAFIILLLLPRACFIYAVMGLGLTLIYPFCKRFFDAPQGVLGVAFSIGIPMTFAAAGQPLTLLTFLLILINILWVIAYDTQYALVDKQDDLRLHLKSTAILFGAYDKYIILGLNFTVHLLWLILGWANHFALSFYFFWGLASFILMYQSQLIKNREPKKCFIAFQSNLIYGILVWIGLLFSFK